MEGPCKAIHPLRTKIPSPLTHSASQQNCASPPRRCLKTNPISAPLDRRAQWMSDYLGYDRTHLTAQDGPVFTLTPGISTSRGSPDVKYMETGAVLYFGGKGLAMRSGDKLNEERLGQTSTNCCLTVNFLRNRPNRPRICDCSILMHALDVCFALHIHASTKTQWRRTPTSLSYSVPSTSRLEHTKYAHSYHTIRMAKRALPPLPAVLNT